MEKGHIILVCGASGTGKTTLSRALGEALGLPAYDTDDFYWVKTDPPFQVNRSYAEIEALLAAEVAKSPHCVIGGSIQRYAGLTAQLRAVVFLTMNQADRMARIMARERERYGARMNPGGDMYETHLEFISWCESYETSLTEPGNRHMQEQWLGSLACPVLRLDATRPTLEQVAHIEAWLQEVAP